ncbi:MAG: hypothetical protein IPO22_18165 [Anaerolineales bacterium]|nr:hypothetical protein [Anaerolineales bacterium]
MFEQLFQFFEDYQWRLDERLHKDDKEINPDVLGYIFEKYINQKQMGAYYTKEDITEYNSKNTIIPHLFDVARKECKIAFEADGALWKWLKIIPTAIFTTLSNAGITVNTGSNPQVSWMRRCPFRKRSRWACRMSPSAERGINPRQKNSRCRRKSGARWLRVAIAVKEINRKLKNGGCARSTT